MVENSLLCARQGAIAILTLNRPAKRNAVNSALRAELAQTLAALDADASVHVIILTGAGEQAFCAGADLSELRDRSPESGAAMTGANAPDALLTNVGLPVIAAINGYAYGLGAHLAVTADIRIATTNAKIRFLGTSFGTLVSGRELPRIVGAPMAKELLFSARVVEAQEALQIGLVNRVVAPEALMPTALELAEQIAANGPAAVRWAKRVVDAATTVSEAEEVNAQARAALVGSPDSSGRLGAQIERITGRRAD